MIVISYGTKNKYAECTLKLRETCEDLGIPHSIELMDDFGTKKEQRTYKPTYILNKIQKLKCPVMWIDADSFLLQKPKVSVFDFDFGYLKASKPGKHWFADSCHFHNYTKSQIEFLKYWKKLCASGSFTHPKLLKTYKKMLNKIKPKDCSKWMRGCYIRNYNKGGEIKY